MLGSLLADRTTGGNVVWASSVHGGKGEGHESRDEIRVSLGFVAQIANMCEADFMRLLGSYGVSVFDYDVLSEFEEDVRNA